MKHVTDLFDPEPDQWGLRGDPWVWRALRDHLTGTYLPPTASEAETMLRTAFNRLVAVDLATETSPSVYRAAFTDGTGPSSGHVSLDTWREFLLPLLIDRALAKL